MQFGFVLQIKLQNVPILFCYNEFYINLKGTYTYEILKMYYVHTHTTMIELFLIN